MFPTSSGGFSFTVALADEQATRRLMVDIATLAPTIEIGTAWPYVSKPDGIATRASPSWLRG